jgi:hypothetical protein
MDGYYETVTITADKITFITQNGDGYTVEGPLTWTPYDKLTGNTTYPKGYKIVGIKNLALAKADGSGYNAAEGDQALDVWYMKSLSYANVKAPHEVWNSEISFMKQ